LMGAASGQNQSAGRGLAVIADTVAVTLPDFEKSSQRVLWETISTELGSDPFKLGNDAPAYLESWAKRGGVELSAADRALFLDRLIAPLHAQGLVRALLAAGIPLQLFGKGWDQLAELAGVWRGEVSSREELRAAIRDGRREFLSQFKTVADPDVAAALPSPVEETTFQRCKLDLNERRMHTAASALHRDLLRIRSTHTVITDHLRVDGAVLTTTAMLIRYFGTAEHLLLIINLGPDLDLSPAPEPLLAPPGIDGWSVIWSSESMAYGGNGTPPLWRDSEWRLPGEAAVLLSGAVVDWHGDE